VPKSIQNMPCNSMEKSRPCYLGFHARTNHPLMFAKACSSASWLDLCHLVKSPSWILQQSSVAVARLQSFTPGNLVHQARYALLRKSYGRSCTSFPSVHVLLWQPHEFEQSSPNLSLCVYNYLCSMLQLSVWLLTRTSNSACPQRPM
jgi:hypothetical protein